ncbi:glycoprotein 3-alpha-L-fucosyltransferase A [Strongylocentrotus purpuratus]|uniref:Fucosyltransferase n=1 Tax=Strongylocentrotus purpuratus TaxID=7668 RepID=A0A7M7TH01_STRPU|nr:glycoprotein 3-alpha-L-fucosyltransferase A [Strongylocentrotus purpuratus]
MYTKRTRMTIAGGALLVIVAFKAYVELRNHLISITYSENKYVASVGRLPYRNESVRPQSNEEIYYEHIPELEDLKLSLDILKTAAVNRDINSNSDADTLWMRKILSNKRARTTFEANRLLYKLQDSALRNSTTGCVIKILQMCHRLLCLKHIKDKAKDFWTRSKCKFSNCRIEMKVGNDLTDFQQSDVVIFHIDKRTWAPLVKTRLPGQLWVFHSKEAPIHGPPASPPREFGNPFNISISYMSESDIAPGYYYLDSEQRDTDPKVLRKEKLMSWVATNCNATSWARRDFVQELQKYLPIDTYGLCGHLDCPRSEKECWEMRGQYKFYLALENSQCPEYITEKLWLNSFAVGTVPIVFGAPKADYERLAPPHSFIHLDDFKTVQEFIDYIHLLDRDQQKYLEYFSWRRLGHVMKGSPILTTMTASNGKTLCFIIRTLLIKSLSPEMYQWQARHPVFYDWWYGMCRADTQKTRIMDIDVTMKTDVDV